MNNFKKNLKRNVAYFFVKSSQKKIKKIEVEKKSKRIFCFPQEFLN